MPCAPSNRRPTLPRISTGRPHIDVIPIRTPGLGDTTYLAHHGGLGVLVDCQRDIGRFVEAAEDHDVQLRYVLETHVHNDYVSGARHAAEATGAELVLPAGAGAAYSYAPAFHNEDLESNGLVVRPLHTPGHTPEHVSYLVLVDRQPIAVFTGGSLLVGSAGRTDLLGADRARQLARLQYHTVRRLAELPDDVALYPTHGAGSFCSVSTVGRASSTIGDEKRMNPVFGYESEEDFIEGQLRGLAPYPSYYRYMAPINLAGPAPLPPLELRKLLAAEVRGLPDDVVVVDARPRRQFAAGHIPGSLGIELRQDFGTWVGWVVPFNTPLALVVESDQDPTELVLQLARIGFDDVVGVLHGLEEWRRAEYPLATFATASVAHLADASAAGHQVLDVRAPSEWSAGHLANSVHTYVPDLGEGAPSALDKDEEVWVACESGYRAAIAASLLERQGYRPTVVVEGGVPQALR